MEKKCSLQLKDVIVHWVSMGLYANMGKEGSFGSECRNLILDLQQQWESLYVFMWGAVVTMLHLCYLCANGTFLIYGWNVGVGLSDCFYFCLKLKE